MFKQREILDNGCRPFKQHPFILNFLFGEKCSFLTLFQGIIKGEYTETFMKLHISRGVTIPISIECIWVKNADSAQKYFTYKQNKNKKKHLTIFTFCQLMYEKQNAD